MPPVRPFFVGSDIHLGEFNMAKKKTAKKRAGRAAKKSAKTARIGAIVGTVIAVALTAGVLAYPFIAGTATTGAERPAPGRGAAGPDADGPVPAPDQLSP